MEADMIVPGENADAVTDILLRHARTGLPGDGLIAVQPLVRPIEIRTKRKPA